MVAHTDVTQNGEVDKEHFVGENGDVLPKHLRISANPAFAPNELRVLKAITGQTMDSLLEDAVDRIQVMIWCELRDLGFNPTWEDAGKIRGEMVQPAPDPTTGSGSTTLLPSAGSGAVPPATSTG